MLAQLALENTTYRFDKPFTYSVPQALETAVRPGVRVTVPFGAGNRTRVAMVLSTSYESGAGQKLKAIASVLDKEPLLDDEMLALIPWMKSRCFCTLYDAVKVMIPAGIGYKLVNRYRMNAAFKNYDREAFTDTAWQIIVALTAAKNGLTGAELTERLGIEEKSSDLRFRIICAVSCRGTGKKNVSCNCLLSGRRLRGIYCGGSGTSLRGGP